MYRWAKEWRRKFPQNSSRKGNDHRVTGSPSYVIVDRKKYTGRVYREYNIIQRQTDKRYKESGTEIEAR